MAGKPEYWKRYDRTPKGIARRKKHDAKRQQNPARIAYRQAHQKRWELASRYGLSLSDYDELKTRQKNRCPICQTPLFEGKKIGNLRIDHDHITNKVRGLLCQRCNVLVGFLETCSSLVPAAQAYLSKVH